MQATDRRKVTMPTSTLVPGGGAPRTSNHNSDRNRGARFATRALTLVSAVLFCWACPPIRTHPPAATLYQTGPGYVLSLHWDGVRLGELPPEEKRVALLLTKYGRETEVYLKNIDRRTSIGGREWIQYASVGGDLWIMPQYQFEGTLLLAADLKTVRVSFPNDNFLMGEFNGEIGITEVRKCLGEPIIERYRGFDYVPFAQLKEAARSNEIVADTDGRAIPMSDMAISYIEDAYRFYIMPEERFIERGGWPKDGEYGEVFLHHRYRGLPQGREYVGVLKKIYKFTPEQRQRYVSWIEANLGPEKVRLDFPASHTDRNMGGLR